MNNLLFSLNFGCMRFSTRRQETYRTIFMSLHEDKKKERSILKLINNLSFFTGFKNIISPVEKDKRTNKNYSVNYRYTKQGTILSYTDSLSSNKPYYNVLFNYHSSLVMHYLFGMFNTGIYVCLESAHNRGMLLITGSKPGTYYIRDYMNSSSYERPVHFMITGQEQMLKIISDKNNIIPLTISPIRSVESNIETEQFYSNIEELKKLIVKKTRSICKSKETKDISDYISINCKITKHIIDFYFQKNILNILLNRAKDIEETLKKQTYLNIDVLSLNLYFDISTLTFIIKHSFSIKIFHFNLGHSDYDIVMRNYIYVLVDNKNTVSIKYTIEQHNVEQNEYIIIYQDKLNYEDIKDKNHYINYQNLWGYYKEQIQNKVAGKIFR